MTDTAKPGGSAGQGTEEPQPDVRPLTMIRASSPAR